MKLSRRSALIGMGSAYGSIGAMRFPAGAAEFAYKLGAPTPATTPLTMRLVEAAEKIKRETGERVEITVYPNSVLGGDTDMLGQLRVGALEFLQIAGTVVAGIAPAAGLDGIPFAFPSYEAAWAALDGPVGAYIRSAVAKTGVYCFEKTWDGSIRQVFNNVRPVAVPDDLKGLKIRVPETPLWIALFKGLGATPVPMNYKEVYLALQTRLIEGVEMGLYIVEGGKLFEVLKYGSMTNHAWTGMKLLANRDVWERIPKNLRDAIDRNFNAAAVLQRNDNLRMDAAFLAQLKGQGVVFNQVDPKPFQAALRKAGLYAQWRSQFGAEAWGVLEKAVGALA